MLLRTNVLCISLAAALLHGAAAQTADSSKQLAEAQQLRAQGHYLEAREAFAVLVRDAERLPAGDHFVAEVLNHQGINENNLANFGGAEAAFNRALSILNAADPLTYCVKTNLAELYIAERRPAEAEPLLRQAATGFRGDTPPDAVGLAEVYNDLAVASAMQGKRPKAETLLRQALALLEEQLGPDHPLLAGSLNLLAGLLVGEHRYAEALVPVERAMHVQQSASLSVGPPDRASVLVIAGEAYAHTGHLVEAESCVRQAVALAESVYGPSQPRLAPYLVRYADVLNRTDHRKEAKQVQKRANAILAQSGQNTGGYTVSASALR